VLPPHDSVPGLQIAEIFHADGFKPPPVSIVTLSVQLTTTLIATGRFVGILPSSVCSVQRPTCGIEGVTGQSAALRYSVGIITVRTVPPAH